MSLPANQAVPGRYGTMNFNNATANTGALQRALYLIGEGLASGTGSDGEISGQLNTFDDAEKFFGATSGGAYMAAKAMRQEGASGVPIYGVFMADAGGAAAKGVLTVANVATSQGHIALRLGGTTWTTSVDNGDAVTDISAAIVASYAKIRDELKPPFTLAEPGVPDGTVVATATQTGAHYGTGTVGSKAGFGWRVIKNTVGGTTVTLDDERLGKSVAGSGVPDPTDIFAALAGVRTHYIVCPVVDPGTDASGSIKKYVAHMRTKSDTPDMLGGVVFAASKLSLSDQITDHDTLETAGDVTRLVYVGIEDPCEWEAAIAAQAAVKRAAEFDVSVPCNHAILSGVDAPTDADRPTSTELNTALLGGVTPAYSPDGTSVEVTRYISATTDKGADPCMDITAIETMDEVRDRGVAAWVAKLKNVKIKEAGQTAYTEKCTTPQGVIDVVLGVLYEMEREDKVQGIDDIKDMVSATLDGSIFTVNIPTPVVNQLAVIDATFALYLSLP